MDSFVVSGKSNEQVSLKRRNPTTFLIAVTRFSGGREVSTDLAVPVGLGVFDLRLPIGNCLVANAIGNRQLAIGNEKPIRYREVVLTPCH